MSPPATTASTRSRISGVKPTAAVPFLASTRKRSAVAGSTPAGGVHSKPWRPAPCAPSSIVSITRPPALSTSTCTRSAGPSSSKPPCTRPTSLGARRLPGTITSRPTRLAPCSAFICANWVPSDSTVRLSFSMPLTDWICAIWLVTCALSIGFKGSWFCICATSSLRKRSSAPAWLAVPAAPPAVPLIEASEVTDSAMTGLNPGRAAASSAAASWRCSSPRRCSGTSARPRSC